MASPSKGGETIERVKIMKKIILTSVIAAFGISPVYAAKILSPSLITPQNNEGVGIKQPLTFSWGAPKSTVGIKQYHLIVSTNDRFVGYDLAKKKCIKATSCADFITKSTSYTMAKTHAFLQKENSYYWQVQAIDKSGNVSLIFNGTESSSSGTANVRKQVNIGHFSVGQKSVDIDDYNAEPKEAANGETFTFNVILTDELPDGQSVKINYGDGWQVMTGSGLNYDYQHAFTVAKSIKDTPISFTVAVFDENDEQQQTRDDSITILANSEPVKINNAPTVEFISGADSVVKNATYTLKLKANDSDGNLNRVEVQWGDGSANDSKTATNGATLSFSHTYKFAGIQPLIATAFDNAEATSEDFTKSINVTEPAATIVKVPVPDVSTINISQSSIVQGNAATFSATLKANLPSGYSVQINYGNGLTKMNGSGTSFTLTATPTSLGSGLFTVGVYDSKNVLKSNQLTGNFTVVEPAPVVIVTPEPTPPPVVTTGSDVETFVSGSKTFSYTKIANDGSELPKTAKLGTAPKEWTCTKDNNTGLIWEVKTTDGGLRDSTKTYTWYEPDASKNGGFAGHENNGQNTYAFTNAVNAQGLCGAKDWRLPTIQELGELLVCSDGQYKTWDSPNNVDKNLIDCTNYGLVTRPAINTTYFPDIKDNYWFWSSSPYAGSSSSVWNVTTTSGGSDSNYKGSYGVVRLVR
jgi:hypothetical protein